MSQLAAISLVLWNHGNSSIILPHNKNIALPDSIVILLQNPTYAVLEQLWGLIACHREVWLPMQDFDEKGKELFI